MGPFQNALALLAFLLSLFSWVSASNIVRLEITLTWEDWAPAGIPRKMILMNGQYPGPPLYLRQGDHVEFLVVNKLPFATTIHFHGIAQTGTPWSDGTPGLAQRPIEPGSSFLYKWHAGQYGSYFYHAHRRGQIEDGLYGAIYIHPDDRLEKPFVLITNSRTELEAMRHAEEKTTPILLTDWRQLTSGEVWTAEEKSGRDAFCVNALLINGKGSVNCLSRQTLDQFTTPAQKRVLGNTSLTDIGCLPPTNAIAQGNFSYNINAIPPTMFAGCTPSHGFTERLLVNPSASYVSFDLISAAGLSSFTFSIDEHPMYVYAVDGRYIVPLLVDAVTIANGNRYSVMVKLDKPAYDYTIRLASNGLNQIIYTTAVMSYDTPVKKQLQPSVPSIDITGAGITSSTVILDENKIIPFPVEVPAQDIDQTFFLNVERYHTSYRWKLGDTSLPLALENSYPLLYNLSAANKDFTIRTRNGTWVDLIFKVTNALQPPHPFHKHSNKFYVIGKGNGDFNYSSVAEAMAFIPESFNLKNPQIRDTFSSPPATNGPTWLAIRYHVINPGAWLLHCHIQVHLSGGLALALLDGVDKWPEDIPEEYWRAVSSS